MAAVRRATHRAQTNSRRPSPATLIATAAATAAAHPMEALEARRLLSTGAGGAGRTIVPASSGALFSPAAGTGFQGYTPAQIRHAYGFDQISGDGTGQTIAISDAYADPSITADLHTFDVKYGLPDPTLTVLNENGRPDMTGYIADPTGDWTVETALDVEWAHAVAPGAKILLLEAIQPTSQDLMATVNSARYLPGVSVISMSWGGRENGVGGIFGFGQPTDFYWNRFMVTPPGHQPITFIASSGDSGVAAASWPATSPYVMGVGGTRLMLDSSNNIKTEGVWIGSQGGESIYEPTPAYQASVTHTLFRATPDVSYDADPGTGFSVFNSTPAPALLDPNAVTGYLLVGGTSAGSPQWAGLMADVNQLRANAGLTSMNGVNETLPALYLLAMGKKTRYENNFNDVASGQNGDEVTASLPTQPIPLSTVPNPRGGGYTGLSATPGWDMVTGLGTPWVPAISQYLASYVPVKVVHRSARRRAQSAVATAAAAKAAKPAAQLLSASVVVGDMSSLPPAPTTAAAATPAAPHVTVTPAAFVVKHLSSVPTTYGVTLSTSTAVSAAPAVSARAAEPALDGSFLIGAPELTDVPVDSAQPAAAPVPTTTPTQNDVKDAAPESAPAAPENEGGSAPATAPQGTSLDVTAPVVAQEVAAASAQPVSSGQQGKAMAFKPSIPMLVGVVAADAVVLGQWFQRRAEAKRRKAAAARFGLTPLVPQDDGDDRVC